MLFISFVSTSMEYRYVQKLQFLGFCCVKYQVCDDESSYTLHNANDDGDVATLMSLTESYCANDFIIIEGSSSTCSLTNTVNRYCGEKFSDVDKQAQDLQICGMFIFFINTNKMFQQTLLQSLKHFIEHKQ